MDKGLMRNRGRIPSTLEGCSTMCTDLEAVLSTKVNKAYVWAGSDHGDKVTVKFVGYDECHHRLVLQYREGRLRQRVFILTGPEDAERVEKRAAFFIKHGCGPYYYLLD